MNYKKTKKNNIFCIQIALCYNMSKKNHLPVQVLQEQGLGRHIDEDFIAAAAVEMQEAMNMTADEFNAAAEQLLMAESSGEFRLVESNSLRYIFD